jgi:hypothetical protein
MILLENPPFRVSYDTFGFAVMTLFWSVSVLLSSFNRTSSRASSTRRTDSTFTGV